jgi:prevent-host-death family protein
MIRTVSIKDAKNRLTALARLVERGETVVVTRNGKPVLDLVPHRPASGLCLAAIEEFSASMASAKSSALPPRTLMRRSRRIFCSSRRHDRCVTPARHQRSD